MDYLAHNAGEGSSGAPQTVKLFDITNMSEEVPQNKPGFFQGFAEGVTTNSAEASAGALTAGAGNLAYEAGNVAGNAAGYVGKGLVTRAGLKIAARVGAKFIPGVNVISAVYDIYQLTNFAYNYAHAESEQALPEGGFASMHPALQGKIAADLGLTETSKEGIFSGSESSDIAWSDVKNAPLVPLLEDFAVASGGLKLYDEDEHDLSVLFKKKSKAAKVKVSSSASSSTGGPLPDPDEDPEKDHDGEKKWTKSQRIKDKQLPTQGSIRFVPDKNYRPSDNLPKGTQRGFLDKFNNEWCKGPLRTPGEPFEWDVQLSEQGRRQLGHLSRNGKHLNVSLKGRITH